MEVKLSTTINDYLSDYAERLTNGLRSVSNVQLLMAEAKILETIQNRGTIYVCGNGGSAAISDHFLCDHSKCIHADTDMRPKIVSLPSSISTITAIANDISYDEIFSHQLKMFADPTDLLIVISASGNSQNIIKALEQADKMGLSTIAFVGFEGGEASGLADILLHVDEKNYGIVEDAHQALMHILAQRIRLTHLNKSTITL